MHVFSIITYDSISLIRIHLCTTCAVSTLYLPNPVNTHMRLLDDGIEVCLASPFLNTVLGVFHLYVPSNHDW